MIRTGRRNPNAVSRPPPRPRRVCVCGRVCDRSPARIPRTGITLRSVTGVVPPRVRGGTIGRRGGSLAYGAVRSVTGAARPRVHGAGRSVVRVTPSRTGGIRVRGGRCLVAGAASSHMRMHRRGGRGGRPHSSHVASSKQKGSRPLTEARPVCAGCSQHPRGRGESHPLANHVAQPLPHWPGPAVRRSAARHMQRPSRSPLAFLLFIFPRKSARVEWTRCEDQPT
jgi:hypothetical protein